MTQIIQLVDSSINTGERLLESSKFIWDMVMRGVILIIMQLVYCVIVFRLHKWNCLFTSVFFLFCFYQNKQIFPNKLQFSFLSVLCIFAYFLVFIRMINVHAYAYFPVLYVCMLVEEIQYFSHATLRRSDLDATHLWWNLTSSSFLFQPLSSWTSHPAQRRFAIPWLPNWCVLTPTLMKRGDPSRKSWSFHHVRCMCPGRSTGNYSGMLFFFPFLDLPPHSSITCLLWTSCSVRHSVFFRFIVVELWHCLEDSE